MATVEITFERALRIWWSYTWRTLALVFPLMFLVTFFLPVTPLPAPGGAATGGADPMNAPQGNPLMLLFIMGIVVVLHIQAFRWMLKTKWREFHLEAVPNQAEANEGGPNP
jgi:hypothetical protein